MNITSDSVRIVCFKSINSDEFLLVSESDDIDNIKLPGGKFNKEDETPQTTAQRELLEELGVPKDLDIKYVKELRNDDGESKRFIFYCFVEDFKIKPSEEISKMMWVNISNIPDCKNKYHILSAVKVCKEKIQELEY